MNLSKSWRLSALALALGTAGFLSGCSSLSTVVQGKGVDYESAKQGNQLDVPPDLTQLARQERYVVPGSPNAPVSALAYDRGVQTTEQVAKTNAVLPQYPGMRIDQAGAQRWLVVDSTPDQLWEKVKGFWQENGFYLTQADATTGIMETDWAENRAKLPQDFIRKYVGKVFDSLYDTGTRDRFRTVFERTPDGKGTQIYVTHQTMKEVYNSNDKTTTAWEPATPDPGLNTIFLRKLMVALGENEQAAKQQVENPAQIAQPVASQLIDNGLALQMQDGFDNAWRKVSLAINTAGFTVIDRNRAAGQFDVRYISAEAALKASQDSTGFFGKLFGKNASAPKPADYRIALQGSGSQTVVSVQTLDGKPLQTDDARKILQILQQQIQ
ncbi:MAG: outer membrane protein assembly factor BamC [Thiomonas sp.]